MSDNPTQDELAAEIDKLAGMTRGSEMYVVRSMSLQVKSNARLEKAITEFSTSTASTERSMRNLAIAQVILAGGAIIAAIIWR